MVSKAQWKPFWLATEFHPSNDLTGWQNCVNYDVLAQAPLGLTLCVLENKLVKKILKYFLSSLPVFLQGQARGISDSLRQNQKSSLLYLVFLLFLKYFLSHMGSGEHLNPLLNQALLCPLGTRKTNFKNCRCNYRPF